MFNIVTTSYFLRRARKFLKKHPDLRNRFTQVMEDLKRDPFAPHLECHPLEGKLKGVLAVSITHSYRITLTIMITERELVLLDIGAHDDVYR